MQLTMIGLMSFTAINRGHGWVHMYVWGSVVFKFLFAAKNKYVGWITIDKIFYV
jgi:hypothetical protein